MQTAPLNFRTLLAPIAQRPLPRPTAPASAPRRRPGLRLCAAGLLAGLLSGLCLSGAAATRYVDVNNAAPAPPYTTWATAATNIQDAVDVAAAGEEIVVTNGVYQTGAREVGGMSNRVAVTKPVTVRSVNGPANTIIQGYQVPETTNGPAAVRCVYLSNGAVLAGFTLTNGAARGWTGYDEQNVSGGGVWCEGPSAVVSNCVLTGNSASLYGGGACMGTLNHCTLTGNSAYFGGGAYMGTLSNCTLTGNSAYIGGGAGYSTLNHCTLTGNSADDGGGGAYDGTLSNCVLTGNSASNYGGGAVGGTLNHCTLTGNSAGGSGGGAAGGTLNHCTLAGNSARSDGGGASGGTLNNCALTGNSAGGSGGGAYGSYDEYGEPFATLRNCTLTGNTASSGGGAYRVSLNNCIVYYNNAPYGGANYLEGTLNYCCTAPLAAGPGNLDAEPQLASAWRLSASSPCIGRGSAAYATGTDLDGEPWADPPSIGCDEYWSGSVTGALSVAVVAAYTNVAVGFSVDFQAVIGGRVSASRWDFGDGMVVSNRPWAAHAWAVAGDYVVELRAYNENNPGGVLATVTVQVVLAEHFVALDSTNPMPPYNSWATAAASIQDAVDAAVVPGALVWVSDGVYQTGTRALHGLNRVAVTKPVTVRSVNGLAVTQIVGYQVPGTTNGSEAVRCVYLTNGAVLAGFTLTNGATTGYGSGGGVWCEGPSAVLSNCVLTGNSAVWGGGAYQGTLNHCTVAGSSANQGGGTYRGMLNHCTLTGNSADQGGGAYWGTLNHCTLTGNSAGRFGGGAFEGALNHCTLAGNSADQAGGGAYRGTLNHCTLTGNLTSSYWAGNGGGAYEGTLNHCALTINSASRGGGAYSGTLNHCTLTDNSASAGGGGAHLGTLNNCTLAGNSAYSGGGAYWATLNNCIVYFNRALSEGPNYLGGTLNYCCTSPLPDGPGNITHAPLFVDTNGWRDLRLQATSPCVNAGNNASAPGPTDLDGNQRIVGGTVDMGAYESQWINHHVFGWLWNAGNGWFGGSAYGWLWFDAGGQWIWSTGLQGWLGIADPNSFTLWSTQFRWLTPSATDPYLADTTAIGPIHFGQYGGTPITDGWVVSDRFGFVWAAGDGVWFYTTGYGWLGVTPDGGIWSVNEGRFL